MSRKNDNDLFTGRKRGRYEPTDEYRMLLTGASDADDEELRLRRVYRRLETYTTRQAATFEAGARYFADAVRAGRFRQRKSLNRLRRAGGGAANSSDSDSDSDEAFDRESAKRAVDAEIELVLRNLFPAGADYRTAASASVPVLDKRAARSEAIADMRGEPSAARRKELLRRAIATLREDARDTMKSGIDVGLEERRRSRIVKGRAPAEHQAIAAEHAANERHVSRQAALDALESSASDSTLHDEEVEALEAVPKEELAALDSDDEAMFAAVDGDESSESIKGKGKKKRAVTFKDDMASEKSADSEGVVAESEVSDEEEPEAADDVKSDEQRSEDDDDESSEGVPLGKIMADLNRQKAASSSTAAGARAEIAPYHESKA